MSTSIFIIIITTQHKNINAQRYLSGHDVFMNNNIIVFLSQKYVIILDIILNTCHIKYQDKLSNKISRQVNLLYIYIYIYTHN
jgi:hypothetical protein